MSISDRLDQIEARCDAATPEPWDSGPLTVVFSTGTDAMVQTVAQTVSRADAEFIASARSDVPELVEAVRRRDAALRAVLDECRKIRAGNTGTDFRQGGVAAAGIVEWAINSALGEGS